MVEKSCWRDISHSFLTGWAKNDNSNQHIYVEESSSLGKWDYKKVKFVGGKEKWEVKVLNPKRGIQGQKAKTIKTFPTREKAILFSKAYMRRNKC